MSLSGAHNSSPGTIPIGSKAVWQAIQLQDEDTQKVIHMIKAGDLPRKNSTNSAVNRFFKHAKLEDNLLVVKSYDPKLLRETNKVVIQPAFLPTVLTMIHQRAKHQMQQIVNRYFFTSGLDHQIEVAFMISAQQSLGHQNPVSQKAPWTLLMNLRNYSSMEGLTTPQPSKPSLNPRVFNADIHSEEYVIYLDAISSSAGSGQIQLSGLKTTNNNIKMASWSCGTSR
jgi:hypothetical protein